MSTNTTVRVRDLEHGALIVCPGDGRVEQVIANRRNAIGYRLVRTNRHDHVRPSHDLITLAERPEVTNDDRYPDGTRVTHLELGAGTVVRPSRTDPRAALVDFDRYGLVMARWFELDRAESEETGA